MRIFRYYLICAILISLSNQGYSQFISNKGKQGTAYLNYSGRNYENYSSTFLRKKFFDNFGNFLVEGTTVYELSEVQKQQTATGLLPSGTSDIIKSRYFLSYFTNLIIANDSYSGFETRLMVGDAIRTKFTSLTFNRARFNGIRWDAGTPKYRGTLIASRISDPIRLRFDSSFPTSVDGIRRIRDWTQYLFGGHFETDIGDMLSLGVTYVNQHQRRSSLDSKEASLKGVVSNVIPRVIFLRISDESPGDNSGPIVFNTPTIIVNGQPRPVVNIFNADPSNASTQLNQPIQFWILRDKLEGRNKGFDISDKGIFRGADTTSFSRLFNYRNTYAENPAKYVYPFRVPSSGTESLTYGFLMPPGVESVQFQITIANDYKIETAQDYVNTKDDYTGSFTSHADDQLLAQLTPFFVRARADGNIRDASNKKVVIINYGLTTGMSVYGMNFQFDWGGFNIEGEFNESVEFLKYPLLSGNRFESKGKAWFIKGKKKLGRFTFGGERYQITPSYTTSLNTYVLENSYFASPSGNFIPTAIPPDFLGFDAPYIPATTILFPGGVFYPLVDDNDDDDRWEDGFYHYQVGVLTTDAYSRNNDIINKNGDYFKLGYRQSSNELRSLEEIVRKPDTGIFPGKDRDNDGIPDDDRNANGVPDYSEDFLTYYADPPTFDYGDDWNNNGIIDEQENDILPDYPYEPDIDGYHVFGNLDLLDGLNLSAGKVHEEAIARGGRNDINYLKAGYFTATPKFGDFRLYYVFKQVRDNIPNDLYIFKGVITTRDPYPIFTVDPLNYRNSLVNSLYLGTKYTQIKDLLIENNMRVELNKQFSIGSRENAFLTPTEVRLLGDQVPGKIIFWGIVNKIDYTFRFFNGALKVSPQFKIRTEKVLKFSEDKQGNPVTEIQQHTQETIPIVRLDYKLTENTDLRFGLQGFSLFGNTFKYKIRNYMDGVESQDRSIIAMSLSNKSQYAGYSVVFDFGFKHTDINYLREIDKSKGTQETSLFFSIYAGF